MVKGKGGGVGQRKLITNFLNVNIINFAEVDKGVEVDAYQPKVNIFLYPSLRDILLNIYTLSFLAALSSSRRLVACWSVGRCADVCENVTFRVSKGS